MNFVSLLDVPVVVRCVLTFVFALGTAVDSSAQGSGTTPTAAAPPYTLHVYEDLVEVPTMVLTRAFADVPGLQANGFSVRLDAGPPFHPSAMRVEGNDPLSVALLVDAGTAVAPAVLEDLQRSISAWTATSLNGSDRLAIYALDCGLFRSSPVVGSAALARSQDALNVVLNNPGLHRRAASAENCGSSRHLWDAVAAVAHELGTQPGRRILIVLTDGIDHGSSETWERMREYAGALSVAIFGIRPPRPAPRPGEKTPVPLDLRFEEPFGLLCAGTGGAVLGIGQQGVGHSLQHITSLVRNRYVLFFPRPANSTPGEHRIDVSVPGKALLVRPTGVVYPPPDKRLSQDPSTVPADPSRAPVLGSRRILQPSDPQP